MAVYMARRIGTLLLVLMGMTVLTFLLSHAVPGNPARLIAGFHAGPAQVRAVEVEYGLNKPLWTQYGIYIWDLVHGNLGVSLQTQQPVLYNLENYFPATMELVFTAMVITVVLGIPLGVMAATHKGTVLDHGARILSISGVAMPAFWLGLVLQLIFFQKLNWLPDQGEIGLLAQPPPHVTGMYVIDYLLQGNWSGEVSALVHLILPAFTLAFGSLAVVTRMLRASLLDVLRQPYIQTVRAKGQRESVVIWHHAIKNAMGTTLTVLGLQFGFLIGNDFLVESVFSWPGIGYYGVQAILSLDYPAIMGVTLVVTVAFVLINLAVDLSYAWVDPRIQYH